MSVRHRFALLFVLTACSAWVYFVLALPPGQNKRAQARFQVALILLSAYAVLIRALLYASGSEIEYDEATLRLAIEGWSPTHVLQPLGFEQTAAPLFIALSWAIVSVWTPNEYAVRLLPFVASCILLLSLYVAATRLWSRRAAIVTLVLAAHHPVLIEYAATFKQYEVDACVAATILAAAAYMRDKYTDTRAWRGGWVGGVVAILISQIAFIPLLVCLVWVGLEGRRRTSQQTVEPNITGWITACTAAWCGLYAALYFMAYAPVGRSPYMQNFWADTYLGMARDDAAKRWAAAAACLWSGIPGSGLVVVPMFAASLWALHQRRQVTLSLLWGGPIGITVVLSCLGLYPVASRLWLFLVPGLLLALGISTDLCIGVVQRRFSVRQTAIIVAASVAVLVGALDQSPFLFDVPLYAIASVRPVVSGRSPAVAAKEAVRSILMAPSSHTVYVAARGVPNWFFYASQLSPVNRRFELIRAALHHDSPGFGDALPERLRFPEPGRRLQLHSGDHLEIYGLASGTPNRATTPGTVSAEAMRGRKPVFGWAANEADRLAPYAAQGFWLYLNQTRKIESDVLQDELRRRGWQLTAVQGLGLNVFYVKTHKPLSHH